jgi:DNA anti-recombination protein RmuC
MKTKTKINNKLIMKILNQANGTKSVVKAIAISFTSIVILGACNSPSKKVENAQTNVENANKELDEANVAYLVEVDTYRKEAAEKINANNKSISEFNQRIAKEKNAAKMEYQKKIADLETKNTDLEKKLTDYKDDGKENWEKFKTEFNQQMNDLGEAIKGLTISGKK